MKKITILTFFLFVGSMVLTLIVSLFWILFNSHDNTQMGNLPKPLTMVFLIEAIGAIMAICLFLIANRDHIMEEIKHLYT